MTIPYNASWFSCFGKFKESLAEDGILFNDLPKAQKIQIQKIHQNFYYNLKQNLKKHFFEKENGDLIKFKYVNYLVVQNSEYKINYKSDRDKYSNTIYMLVEDEKSTQRALEANNMHYLDSLLVKEMLNKLSIIPIHDCFGVRLCELHLLIDSINEYYSKKMNLTVYGLHVII